MCTARTGRDADVCSIKCRTESCGKRLSFGVVAGAKTGEYCAQHALEGMAGVKSRKCRTARGGKQPLLGVVGTRMGSTVHSTHWRGWSTSVTESAEPQAATSNRFSELWVLKQGSTVHSTHRKGWSTSRAESAEPKVAASYRVSELQVRKL